MPLVSESLDFSHLDALDVPELHARYAELKASLSLLPNGTPDPSALQDDAALHELCVILSHLRKKTAGPPRRPGTGVASKRSRTVIPETSIDEL